MRLVSCFVLSLALHSAAWVYPVSFGDRSQEQFIQVTIRPMEQEGGDVGGRGGNGSPHRRDDSKPHRVTPPTVEPRVEPKSFANPEPQARFSENASASNSSIALASAIANSADAVAVGAVISGPMGNDANGFDGFGGTVSGNGFGAAGTSSGRGSGSGSESGMSGTGIVLTPARYRNTPSPEYPESARRDGREGRVLVRVLVDDQGRSKHVEINSSSGSDALDRAAAQAIKRWHFHPARHGDKPVESWLRIPIEFHLAEINSRRTD